MKMLSLLFLLTGMILLAMLFLSPAIVSAGNLQIKTGQWVILKQEKGTETYVSDKYSKTPLVCELYPEVKDKKDLPSKSLYTAKDKTVKKAVEQKSIKDKWGNCYQVSIEDYVQIGDNSTILIYQDYSMVEFIDGDNNEITTNFLLKKFNGTAYNIEPNDIWIKTQEECANLGKEGLCFGATDNSINETQLADYRYEINSTSQLSLIVREKDGYSYPVFTTSFNLAHWGEQTQEYKFDDICKNEYSKCNWDLVGNYAYINFVSNKYIDPTIFAGGNGSISNPYQINNCTQLQAMNESLTSYYSIINNIDCSGVTFTPVLIGEIFSGALNGQNYNISNLFITGTGLRVGLISDLSGNISNVNIVNASVTGNDNIGILVGYQRDGIIKNSNIYGGIVNGLSSSGNIGGMVGRMLGNSIVMNSTVNNVRVTNDVASATSIGGFVGIIGGNANITTSGVNYVNVSGKGAGAVHLGGFCGRSEAPISKSYANQINITGGAGGYVGGFVGYIATTSALINECWVVGNINSQGTYTGGFTGRLIAPIVNSFSVVNITTNADYVGGFIGYSSSSYIYKSYSAGLVTRTVGGSYIGGFAGRNTLGNISNCYYDNQTSNQTDIGKGTPLSTIKMKQQASFVDWDFTTPIWYITENVTYPSLRPLNDTTSPVVNIDYPINGNYYNINITSLNYTVVEANPSMCWWSNETTNSTSNVSGTNFTYGVLANIGNNNWTVYCNDTAGNIGNDTHSFYVDFTNPNATLIYPTNNSYNKTLTQNFTVNATDDQGLKNATLYIYNFTNTLVNQTTVINISGSKQSTIGIVVSLIDGIYHWFYKIFDLAGNSFTTQNNSLTIDETPPTISIITPNGEFYNYNQYVVTGIRVNDSMGNVSSVKATVTKPDMTTENLNLILSPENVSIFPLYAYYSQFIITENETVQPNQTCVALVNTAGGYTSLSGNGDPETDTFCSVISTLPFYDTFTAIIYYNLTNLSIDSAINFQVTSGQPTSTDAVSYAFIGRTNFAGEGNQYQVFGTDNVSSGYLIKTDTTDTYGAMKITRLNNTFSFYVLNNTAESWILLGSQSYNFNQAVFMLAESESIGTNWGNASSNWTNLTVTGLDPTIYKGIYHNTTINGTYTITYFANDTLNNINNYTQASFKINEINQAPTVPFVITPIIDSLNNKFVDISWSQVIDANNDTVVFNISLLNQDHSFNRTIIDNYGNLNTNNYMWNTSTVPDGNYSITVQVRETLTFEKYSQSDTLSGYFIVDNTAPVCTLISRTPTDINDSSTGLFNVLINCTDMHGINVTQIAGHYGAFTTRTVDAFVLSAGIPNYFSNGYPNNSLAVTGILTPPYQVWRAEGRNRGYWYENLTGLSDCTGINPCYQILNDTFSYAIDDGHYGYMQLTNTSSTEALLNFTYIVETTVFRPSVYLSWDSMIAEPKKNYSMTNNNYMLMKRFDAEAYRNVANYTMNAFRNIDGQGSPTATLNAYYCNISYDPAGSTKVINSPNCNLISAMNTTNLNNRVLYEKNSSYSRGSYAITNGLFGGIKATAEFYIEYETLESNPGSSYEIKYANGSTITNVGFNETNVAWTTTDGGITWVQASWTPDVFTETVRSMNDEFQFGIYVKDNLGNVYQNFTFIKDEITPTNHPITIPAIIEYNSTLNLENYNLNGTYRKLMNIKVGVSSDPDAPGTVTHNLSLFNIDGTFNYTINENFHSPSDADLWIDFDTTLVPDGNYKMNIMATADDNPLDYKSRTTTQIFSIENYVVMNLSFDKSSPQTYPTSIKVLACSNNQNLSTVLYRDGVNVTNEINQSVVLGAGVWNYSCQFLGDDNYSYTDMNVSYVINPITTTTNLSMSPASPISSGTASNFSCTNSNNLSVSLFINGVDKTSELGLNLTRASGIYTVNCSYAGSQNYSASSQQATYVISGSAGSLDFVFTPTGNTFPVNQDITFISYCYDLNYTFCSSDITCTLSLYSQNFTLLLDKANMTRGTDNYYYTQNSLQNSITGNYNGLVRCSNLNVVKTSSFTYIISSTGSNVNDDVQAVAHNVWSHSSRNLTYYPDASINTSGLNLSVNVNSTEIANAVWNTPERNLTYYPEPNYTLIAENVWDYSGTVNPNLLSQIANSVWVLFNNTYTFISTIASDVWNNPTRELTYYPTVNLTLSNDSATAIASAVWDYNGTVSNSLLSQFSDKFLCVTQQLISQLDAGKWGVDIVTC